MKDLGLYKYRALVLRWVDGDTVDALVDLGFRVETRIRFRLYGVNTPERGQPLYKEATDHALDLAPIGSYVRLRTHGTGKYGRWLAEVFPETASGMYPDREGQSVNESLIAEGLGVPYMGGAR